MHEKENCLVNMDFESLFGSKFQLLLF